MRPALVSNLHVVLLGELLAQGPRRRERHQQGLERATTTRILPCDQIALLVRQGHITLFAQVALEARTAQLFFAKRLERVVHLEGDFATVDFGRSFVDRFGDGRIGIGCNFLGCLLDTTRELVVYCFAVAGYRTAGHLNARGRLRARNRKGVSTTGSKISITSDIKNKKKDYMTRGRGMWSTFVGTGLRHILEQIKTKNNARKNCVPDWGPIPTRDEAGHGTRSDGN